MATIFRVFLKSSEGHLKKGVWGRSPGEILRFPPRPPLKGQKFDEGGNQLEGFKIKNVGMNDRFF